VEVHRYRFSSALHTAEHSFSQLAVFLPHTDRPCKGELTMGENRVSAELNNEVVTIAPAGLRRRATRDKPGEVTAIFLDPLVLSAVARSETGLDYPEIMPQFGIADPVIRSIGMLLYAEMRSGNPKPRSYAESLASAMASHIFSVYARPVYREMRSLGSNWAQLKRSIEYLHDHAEKNVGLDELASIANMSKFHFAKTFRHAMGIAPHQYLVKLRIEKARKLLTDPGIPLHEVAGRVGYADKGQFNAQFLKIVGMTPGSYRSTP
jgi:AraC family transcriptional regulator